MVGEARLRFAYERLVRLAVTSISEVVGRSGRSICGPGDNWVETSALGALGSGRWRHPPRFGTLLCWGWRHTAKMPCRTAEVSLACRETGGVVFTLSPLRCALLEAWVYPTDFSTAAANEQSAAQMDQPSPRDSITTTRNAAPATSRGPIACADRWGSSNIQSVR
jgi:hypothetical protein